MKIDYNVRNTRFLVDSKMYSKSELNEMSESGVVKKSDTYKNAEFNAYYIDAKTIDKVKVVEALGWLHTAAITKNGKRVYVIL